MEREKVEEEEEKEEKLEASGDRRIKQKKKERKRERTKKILQRAESTWRRIKAKEDKKKFTKNGICTTFP